MYKAPVNKVKILANITNNELLESIFPLKVEGRFILKDGYVVDPKNNLEMQTDIAFQGDKIVEVGSIEPAAGDVVLDCKDLLVVPGLIDMHLHLGDLFEVTTNPIFEAATHGITYAFSPGAGNTLMAPSLLGAEVDRGLPINLGVYLGASNVLATCMDTGELAAFFRGECADEVAGTKMSRNPFTLSTGNLVMGIKDHMGHYIMDDEKLNKVFDVTSQAKMLFMSHTQDPDHSMRLANLSNGRPFHLGHTTAVACGTHGDPVESMKRMIDLCKEEHITGEFVTTMLRENRGSREGLLMDKVAQDVAYQALSDKIVDILISDGQNDATMKGFGDCRDNIPCILELVEKKVLSLSDAVATMTCNPAKLFYKRTGVAWWDEKVGHLGVGALANITVIDRSNKSMMYTICNGEITGFEKRVVRRGIGAGGLVTKSGMVRKTGVGDITLYSVKR